MPEHLIDGQPADRIPADDRGFRYGDGLFETVAFYGRRHPLWPWHMRRLAHGCSALGLPRPDPARLLAECLQLADPKTPCVIRITLTRGVGGSGYRPAKRPQPLRVLSRRAWPEGLHEQWRSGITAGTYPEIVEGMPLLQGLKHLNRLPQVLAADFASRMGFEEAFLIDRERFLIDALTGNLVVCDEGRLMTPAPASGAVGGVGLGWLRDQPDAKVESVRIRAGSVPAHAEVWVINSVSGIRPVRQWDGRQCPIGSHTRDWQARWLEMTGLAKNRIRD